MVGVIIAIFLLVGIGFALGWLYVLAILGLLLLGAIAIGILASAIEGQF